MKAPLVLGPNSNTFYALFEEDDVDFKLVIDNHICSDRTLSFDVDVLKERKSFIVKENSKCALQTMESNGHKFHFVRQSSDSGKAVVSEAVSRYGLTQNEASTMTSQMKLGAVYSKKIHDIWIQLNVLEGVVNGLKSPIPMKSCKTIKDLKEKIDKMTVDYPIHPLKYDEKFLDYYENQNLDQMGMKQVVTLDIKFKPITIFVKTARGKRIPFQISPTNQITNLKRMIETRCGVIVNRQKLVHKSKTLKDDFTAFDAEIKNDETIELREGEITIIIKISETRTMEFAMLHTDSVKKLKLKIQKELGILPRHQTLTLKSKTTSTLTYLSDDLSFQWYKFKDYETIALTTEKYPVKVNYYHTCHTFEVNPMNTIATLKGLLEDKFKIRKIDQKLMVGEKRQNDEITIANSILRREDSIQLSNLIEYNIQCCVKKLTGDAIKIEIGSEASIHQLKMKIGEKEGTPEDQQRLIYAGKQLEDGMNLSDYGIMDKSTIHLILKLRGGGGNVSGSDPLQEITDDQDPLGKLSGERGAICFGEKSNQTFGTAHFDKDEMTMVEPFIIEMRMAD